MLSEEDLKKRRDVYNYFVNVAIQENKKNNEEENQTMEVFFDQNENKRVLFVIEKSIGDIFICTSLFQSIKELYPEHDLYVATSPQYFQLLEGNPFVHKVIPFHPNMENEIFMTGAGNHNGFVDVLYTPSFVSQKQLNYLSKDKIALNLNG